MALLKELMQLPELSEFNLVGGTALALQMGHRLSVDFDFFTEQPYDSAAIIAAMPKPHTIKANKGPFLGLAVQGVKVDFMKYAVPLLYDPLEIDGIRMLDWRDISAMKLMAITQRGAKKDFWDLYFLLQEFTLEQILEFFKNKYPSMELFFVLKSLHYFDEADAEPDPVPIAEANWRNVKQHIEAEVNKILR